MLKGFKKFILRGNVVDLSVGIVIGAAFNSIVQTFVKGVLTPFLGLIGGQPNFSNLTFTIAGSTFLIGDFLNAVISFLIIASVVYFFVIVPMNKLKDLTSSGKIQDPTTKSCEFCYSEIPIKATRCPNCTSRLMKEKK